MCIFWIVFVQLPKVETFKLNVIGHISVILLKSFWFIAHSSQSRHVTHPHNLTHTLTYAGPKSRLQFGIQQIKSILISFACGVLKKKTLASKMFGQALQQTMPRRKSLQSNKIIHKWCQKVGTKHTHTHTHTPIEAYNSFDALWSSFSLCQMKMKPNRCEMLK